MPMRNITMAEWNLIKKIRATGDCGCGTLTEEKVAEAVVQVAAESAALRGEEPAPTESDAAPVDSEPEPAGVPDSAPASEADPTPIEGAPVSE